MKDWKTTAINVTSQYMVFVMDMVATGVITQKEALERVDDCSTIYVDTPQKAKFFSSIRALIEKIEKQSNE